MSSVARHNEVTEDDVAGEEAVEDGTSTVPANTFGEKIRHGRKRQKLTLVELASQCNISASFLSQIERGVSRPSVATLYKLATALDLSMSSMFTGAPPERVVEPVNRFRQRTASRTATSSPAASPREPSKFAQVIRAHERPVIIYPGSQIHNELLTPRRNSALQMMWVVIPAGEGTGDEGLVHEGEECGLIIQGQVGVWVGPPGAEEYYELGPGDAIYQDSKIPHRSMNIGDETVLIVTAVTPPSF